MPRGQGVIGLFGNRLVVTHNRLAVDVVTELLRIPDPPRRAAVGESRQTCTNQASWSAAVVNGATYILLTPKRMVVNLDGGHMTR